MTDQHEVFISVDVETAGPIPGEFSLLSIGACAIDNKSQTFGCEIKPINHNADPMALKISGLSLESLEQIGLAPEEAMKQFANWLKGLTRAGETLVFVGFNAPFDWSFVNYYFHKFVGENPFGISALDIKAYYMGAAACRWSDTKSSRMAATLQPQRQPNHSALHDAEYQAELFRLIRKQVISKSAI